ncbi:EAL domain-containing protein [Shewanella sp. JBTF-M18]|uniref:EAL domain-containing protein n=1 Tax=Shewanella insulae TaxID=2681496 RepID=A0A6L7HTH9_9GAMM|nr:EAL domain-containing protein [Shewanella insulae]MXR67505.1 EAL domain-containing protein [Shewanella insulae]
MKLSQLTMGCEYQPFIALNSGQITGYEALARFFTPKGQPTPPNQVFEQLHDTPDLLGRVEYAAKHLQLSRAPKDKALFLNLDPHGLSTALITDLIKQIHRRPNTTIELIENTCASDARQALSLASQLRAAGIDIALDDIGAPHAMLSLALTTQVDCLKFDKIWLKQLHQPHTQGLLKALINFARTAGKLTILEGVETREELTIAQEFQFDWVQGFHYRDAFIQAEIKLPLAGLLEADTLG